MSEVNKEDNKQEVNTVADVANTKKKYKTFAEYYSDPTYRARHNARMCEKVECKCGCEIARSNMWKHKKTTKHKELLVEKEKQLNRDNEKLKEIMKIALTLCKAQKQL